MDANEMRAISQLVADLNAEIHNEVRMLNDRVSVLEGQVESLTCAPHCTHLS